MNKTTEALKLAEEALRMISTFQEEDNQCDNGYGAAYVANEALAAVREALADPVKQEPVAWLNPHNQAVIDVRKKKQIGEGKGYPNFSIPLYAAPLDTKAIRAEVLEEAEEIAKTIGGSFSVEFLAAIRGLK